MRKPFMWMATGSSRSPAEHSISRGRSSRLRTAASLRATMARGRELLFERGDDLRQCAVHSLIERLHGEAVVIRSMMSAGKEVGFGVHQPVSV